MYPHVTIVIQAWTFHKKIQAINVVTAAVNMMHVLVAPSEDLLEVPF